MKSARQKIYLTSVLFGILFLLLIIFGILPSLGKVKKSSQELSFQKSTLNLFQSQLEDLRDFQKKFTSYQSLLAKLENSFVVKEAPIRFIEFLEKEAKSSDISLEIVPLNLKPSEVDLWFPLGFSLSFGGSFPDCLRFLERLERGPFLVEISQLNIGRISEKSTWQRKFENLQPGDVYFTLTLKVFSSPLPLEEK